jgi:hypothetical protein
LILKKRVLILKKIFQIVGHFMGKMWLEEYAEKLAHFFEFLLPQAKLSRGITRDLVGERTILCSLLSGEVLRLVLLSAKRCGVFLILKACTCCPLRKRMVENTRRLNFELDLQSLFGLLCTAVLVV